MEKVIDLKESSLDELFAFSITNKVEKLLLASGENVVPLLDDAAETKVYENIARYKNQIINGKLSEKEKRELYLWARNNTRYIFLNYIIKDFISDLLSDNSTCDTNVPDLFLATNLVPIMGILKDMMYIILNNKRKTGSYELSYISKEDVISLVKELLLVFDPSSCPERNGSPRPVSRAASCPASDTPTRCFRMWSGHTGRGSPM